MFLRYLLSLAPVLPQHLRNWLSTHLQNVARRECYSQRRCEAKAHMPKLLPSSIRATLSAKILSLLKVSDADCQPVYDGLTLSLYPGLGMHYCKWRKTHGTKNETGHTFIQCVLRHLQLCIQIKQSSPLSYYG